MLYELWWTMCTVLFLRQQPLNEHWQNPCSAFNTWYCYFDLVPINLWWVIKTFKCAINTIVVTILGSKTLLIFRYWYFGKQLIPLCLIKRLFKWWNHFFTFFRDGLHRLSGMDTKHLKMLIITIPSGRITLDYTVTNGVSTRTRSYKMIKLSRLQA